MGKKKTNPNRIPATWNEADTKRAVDEVTQDMILRAWALVLCALAGRWDTTAESLLSFWDTVNHSCTKLESVDDIEKRLDSLADTIGVRFPFHRIKTDQIRSKAAVEKAYRKLRQNSLHAMFALIADTVIQKSLMDHETICRLFEKVRDMSLDVERGELSDQDLLGVLEDEFALRLLCRGESVVLEAISADMAAPAGSV